jgi:hypothetical protein
VRAGGWKCPMYLLHRILRATPSLGTLHHNGPLRETPLRPGWWALQSLREKREETADLSTTLCFVSGHDFSRAVTAKNGKGFSPCHRTICKKLHWKNAPGLYSLRENPALTQATCPFMNACSECSLTNACRVFANERMQRTFTNEHSR